MNKETVQEIKNALEPLAEKLGEGASFVYETYVRQQYIYGIASLIIIAVLVAISAIGIRFLWRHTTAEINRRNEDYKEAAAKSPYASRYADGYDTDMWMAIKWVGSALWAGTVTLIALIWGYDALLHLLNPHYYAIKEILGSIKGE